MPAFTHPRAPATLASALATLDAPAPPCAPANVRLTPAVWTMICSGVTMDEIRAWRAHPEAAEDVLADSDDDDDAASCTDDDDDVPLSFVRRRILCERKYRPARRPAYPVRRSYAPCTGGHAPAPSPQPAPDEPEPEQPEPLGEPALARAAPFGTYTTSHPHSDKHAALFAQLQRLAMPRLAFVSRPPASDRARPPRPAPMTRRDMATYAHGAAILAQIGRNVPFCLRQEVAMPRGRDVDVYFGTGVVGLKRANAIRDKTGSKYRRLGAVESAGRRVMA